MSEVIMSTGLPLTQENIPAIIDALKTRIERLRTETAHAQAELAFVRSTCTHPSTEKGSYQGRWDYERCTYCGKEW